MNGTSRDADFSSDSDRNPNLSDIRLSHTDRLESFSDGILSITIILLVIDVVTNI
jgi:hypothetical protein